MFRQKELKWFYQYGASEIYPEAWQGFLDEIKPEERSNLMEAYRKIFNGEDQEKNSPLQELGRNGKPQQAI